MSTQGIRPKRDEFAEAMANHGGTVAEVAAMVGITLNSGRKHFKAMRRDLGWQAQ